MTAPVITHAFVSGKTDGADATQVQPSNWNADHDIEMAAPGLLGRSTSGAGAAEEIAVGSGLTLSSGTLSSSGGGVPFRPHIEVQSFGTTAPTVIGSAALTARGTAQNGTAGSGAYAKILKTEYNLTSAAANGQAGFYSGRAMYGAMKLTLRFGLSTGGANTNKRMAVGLLNAAGALNGSMTPGGTTGNSFYSNGYSGVYFGFDNGDTNLHVFTLDANVGSGVTKVDLGSDFPKPSADRTTVYHAVLELNQARTLLTYSIRDIATGDEATGTVTTTIPDSVNVPALAPNAWVSTGATSSTIGLGLMALLFEDLSGG